jgi:hypothetical protein
MHKFLALFALLFLGAAACNGDKTTESGDTAGDTAM